MSEKSRYGGEKSHRTEIERFQYMFHISPSPSPSPSRSPSFAFLSLLFPTPLLSRQFSGSFGTHLLFYCRCASMCCWVECQSLSSIHLSLPNKQIR